MKSAAFLDRDGVLIAAYEQNGVPTPVRDESEVKILEGVVEAVQLLFSRDFVPVVITNQPDVSRLKTTLNQVNRINERISIETGIEYFYICPHDEVDGCDCRKPKPGLVTKAARDLHLDYKTSFLVGDRWRDIELGNALGMPSYFIDYSYTEKMPNPPYIKIASLLEATLHFLGDT
jgi:D-glycero-D-manno-heptose 1,7-bisphosphate phosphatase